MFQNLPLGDFKWFEETSQCSDFFIKSYDKNSEIRYFLELDVPYPEKLHKIDEV